MDFKEFFSGVKSKVSTIILLMPSALVSSDKITSFEKDNLSLDIPIPGFTEKLFPRKNGFE